MNQYIYMVKEKGLQKAWRGTEKDVDINQTSFLFNFAY